MNEPLDYRGYKIYQSSYEEGKDGAPTFSIFSVGKDPGMPVKYAGSILLVSGIALMFWLKPLFVQKRLAAKRQEKMQTVIERQTSFGGRQVDLVAFMEEHRERLVLKPNDD